VGVLVVNGNTDYLGVARLELVSELAECCNLGGANEGEVLRPEEDDAPGAFVQTLGGDGGEVVFGLGCFDVSQLTGVLLSALCRADSLRGAYSYCPVGGLDNYFIMNNS